MDRKGLLFKIFTGVFALSLLTSVMAVAPSKAEAAALNTELLVNGGGEDSGNGSLVSNSGWTETNTTKKWYGASSLGSVTPVSDSTVFMRMYGNPAGFTYSSDCYQEIEVSSLSADIKWIGFSKINRLYGKGSSCYRNIDIKAGGS